MIPYMVGKLAPNSSHLTRGLVKYVPGRGYFRAVSSQNGDKFVTSPPSPPPIVEQVESSCLNERKRLAATMHQRVADRSGRFREKGGQHGVLRSEIPLKYLLCTTRYFVSEIGLTKQEHEVQGKKVQTEVT